MKNIYLRFVFYGALSVLFLSACRKDKSSFVIPDTKQGSGDNRNCQVLTYGTEDQSTVATYKYEQDSIVTEIIRTDDGTIDDAWYVKIEAPKQLLVFENNKKPESAQTRIYLNADGSIDREIKVTLNPDGTTYKELPGKVNTFVYNEKKQLIRIDIKMDVEEVDEGEAHFTYDEKNRIKKIVILDVNKDEVFIYDNFTYDPQAKNDNFLTLDVLGSPASYFIPSLRNIYIKGYRTRLPAMDLFTTVYGYNYTFKDGKLTDVKMKINIFGVEQEVKLGVTLKCK